MITGHFTVNVRTILSFCRTMLNAKVDVATSPGLPSASAHAPDLTGIFKNVYKFPHNKTQDNKKAKPAAENVSTLSTGEFSKKRVE